MTKKVFFNKVLLVVDAERFLKTKKDSNIRYGGIMNEVKTLAQVLARMTSEFMQSEAFRFLANRRQYTNEVVRRVDTSIPELRVFVQAVICVFGNRGASGLTFALGIIFHLVDQDTPSRVWLEKHLLLLDDEIVERAVDTLQEEPRCLVAAGERSSAGAYEVAGTIEGMGTFEGEDAARGAFAIFGLLQQLDNAPADDDPGSAYLI
ncbi:MAG: hypothetical protein WC052_04060 [Patescibacteria group bacterium]